MTSLSPWQNFASTDLDTVQSSVSSLIKPHHLSLQNSAKPLQTHLRFAQLGRISLMRLRYGADVRIQPEPLAGFYLVQIPQYGYATVKSGNECIDSSPQIATVLDPNAEIDMVWRANNEQLMLKIDRALMEQMARHFDARFIQQKLVFPLGFQVHQHINWQLMMRYLIDCARQSESVLQSPLLLTQLEQLVVTTFLELHPPLIEAETRRIERAPPKAIRRVEEYLHEHADQAIRLEQLAEVAQMSVRSLHAGFQEHCGISPMQYLKQIRLERARLDLSEAEAGSITDVALRWGFMHLGRFSMEYKRRFGESPSQTFKRARS